MIISSVIAHYPKPRVFYCGVFDLPQYGHIMVTRMRVKPRFKSYKKRI